VPITVTNKPEVEAIIVPGRVVNWLRGNFPAMTWMP
jgi:hypothetical protein